MLGAIYGDKAGSIYEYAQTKKVQPVNPQKLIVKESFFSDDTIETIAVLDAIQNQKDYGETLREYILEYESYHPNFSPYFKHAFSPNTLQWAKKCGRSNSRGNGALMRISPVGFLFDQEEEVMENAILATIPSHNSEEAIFYATKLALMIYYFRKGYLKEEVFSKLKCPVEYKPFLKFNTTCEETFGNCCYAIHQSSSFEDAMRKALLMGGDTDTNCCIVGSVAEAIYGLTDEEKEDAQKDLPESFQKVLRKGYLK